MKIQGFKRITAEDFDEKDKSLVSKIAYSINVFAEDVTTALNKNISIEDNLSIVKKDITITVDRTGTPTTSSIITSGLGSFCSGMQVIKATNITNPSVSPTNQPFITFSDNEGKITISKITGLQADNKYILRVILYP